MSSEKVKNIVEKTRNEIIGSKTDFFEEYPTESYIDLINQYPKIASYHYVCPEVARICDYIRKKYGEPLLENFHKLLLLQLILKNSDKIQTAGLPEEIISLYKINFNRIAEEIEKNNYNGSYLYSNDKFCKDIAVCSMRLIPVGARKIHISGLSRRFLLKGGIPQFLKGLAYILFELKGIKPMFQMHTDSKDPDLLKNFNEDGWEKSYLRIAELLKADSKIKGVFGASWFYDPELEHVSPRLAYIRKMVINNGGEIFCVGSDDQAVKNATQKSMTRRKLYEEGKYLPTNYLLIWPRDRLINWSDQKSKSASPNI
ncbi:MAG: hypothetical protein GY795_22180 [Desulfobacterales bacterium]|nr:hypothetical protein [Desulfobacterales bacterium]